MKKKYFLLVSIISLLSFSLHAQLGGRYAYSFLDQSVSARVAALGGNVAAIDDNDINVGFVNPSLINPGMNNALGFNYINSFAGFNFGSLQYANTFKKAGSFLATLQFMDYGKFDLADETGTINGSFGASDFALNIGWGRRLDSLFSIGATAKLIYSFYESYTSFGLAVDVAGTYHSKSGWVMSLVARNIGMQVTTYTSGVRDPLPFNVQYVITKRLDHVPFRFHLIYDHIEKWDLTYEDSANPSGGFDPITGEAEYNTGFAKFGDQFMRHLIFGAELYLGKNFILRGSYNYRRRQELKITNKTGMVGFSWGFGIRIYKFKINYSRSTYHLVGSPNYISLVFDMNSFIKN